MSDTKPVIGMAATLIMLSDRHAYTVISVSPSGKTIKAQRDKAIRIDSNGASEAQEYSYQCDANAEIETFRLGKHGNYRNAQGTKLSLGERYSYHDFSF